MYGELALRQLYLGSIETVRTAQVTLDGESVSATLAAEETGWTVMFGEELLLKPGQGLEVVINSVNAS